MLYLPSLPAAGAAAPLGWRVFGRFENLARCVRYVSRAQRVRKGAHGRAIGPDSFRCQGVSGGRQQNLGVACDPMTPGL
jgi:hypothetical protein